MIHILHSALSLYKMHPASLPRLLLQVPILLHDMLMEDIAAVAAVAAAAADSNIVLLSAASS